MKRLIGSFLFFMLLSMEIIGSGCANIIPPGGGPKDTLAPVLVNATPRDSITSFTGNKITLTFNEYIQLDNVQQNLIVSPNPQNPPLINSKLKVVTIKLKDSLEPNTTYSINFGNAVKDVNEGNIAKNLTYIFSTGKHIDEHTLSGKVILAETGKTDSTLIVVLHKNLADSAVAKDRPTYYTTLDGKGNFQFRNLPAGTFAMYALPNDYSKKYNDSTKLFAFLNEPVNTADSLSFPDTLYAYRQAKEKEKSAASAPASNKTAKENKHLRFTTSLEQNRQDLLSNFQLNFDRRLKTIDTSKIILADTNYKPVSGIKFLHDSSQAQIALAYPWPENTYYKLIILKDAVTDTTGATLLKNDTLTFTTKRESDYGSITLRFQHLDLSKNPVLQLVQNNLVVDSATLTENQWSRKLYKPGEYEIRILFDKNKNGTWDPGKFFGVHKQPEIVIAIPSTIKIRGNWDNETDIDLMAKSNLAQHTTGE